MERAGCNWLIEVLPDIRDVSTPIAQKWMIVQISKRNFAKILGNPARGNLPNHLWSAYPTLMDPQLSSRAVLLVFFVRCATFPTL